VWVRKSEADSISLLNSFKDSIFLKDNGFTEDVMVMFIPNTYETYWNTSAGKFRDKMIKKNIAISGLQTVWQAKKTRFKSY
jgi:UPF0755 protein